MDTSASEGPEDPSELLHLLLSTGSVDTFLTELTGFAASSTGHSASLTINVPAGTPFTAAHTDELTLRLDEQQYADRQGPCLEALSSGVPVFVTDMAAETRWGSYPGQAAERGVRSSMSYPLINDDHTLGALNLYAFRAMIPDTGLQARASQLADRAAGALAVALRMADQDEQNAPLQTALTSRSIIDQAIGILMGQQRCGPDTAFDLLRQTSQHRNLKLRDVAAQIVSSVQRGGAEKSRGRY